jgi:hypothetical protein
MKQGQELITREDRQQMCSAEVTLNGEPARITGSGTAYARVTQKRTGLGCEFAWATAKRVLANGGHFKSF